MLVGEGAGAATRPDPALQTSDPARGRPDPAPAAGGGAPADEKPGTSPGASGGAPAMPPQGRRRIQPGEPRIRRGRGHNRPRWPAAGRGASERRGLRAGVRETGEEERERGGGSGPPPPPTGGGLRWRGGRWRGGPPSRLGATRGSGWAVDGLWPE